MKPFNLTKALAGKPVVTRDGREVSEIHYFKTRESEYKLAVVIDGILTMYPEDGSAYDNCAHPDDLFMVPEEKKKVWLVVFDGYILAFENKGDAYAHSEKYSDRPKVVEVEYEL